MKSESKEYPKILRSKKEKAMFFPDEIEEFQKENEGIVETFYRYDTIKLSDNNQQIEDYEKFKKENCAELRRHRYGSWEKQFEIMQEQGFGAWQAYCNQIKAKLPK
jgi:hypothetical protein